MYTYHMSHEDAKAIIAYLSSLARAAVDESALEPEAEAKRNAPVGSFTSAQLA